MILSFMMALVIVEVNVFMIEPVIESQFKWQICICSLRSLSVNLVCL